MIKLETLGLPETPAETAAFNPGDVIKVHVKIKEGDKERVQIFQGTVIQLRGIGANRTFTVRKTSAGIGVERIFPLHSPNVAKIELITKGKVRRAKLYYTRELTGRAARVKERKSPVPKAAAGAAA